MITLLKLNRPSCILVLAVCLVSLTGAMMTANHVQAAGSYYVDCSAPTNGNGSQSSPWNNLTTVNATTFGPADQILLKRGTTCAGQTLSPHGSGASGSPIIIDAYGTGNKPIIAGNGLVERGVYLFNQEYWEVRNLEVTNHGPTVANRQGVVFQLQNFGVGHHLYAINLTVHDVNGTDTKDAEGSGGIYYSILGATTPTKWDDLLVEGNTVYTVDRSGIIMWSYWNDRPELPSRDGAWYPSTNVIMRNNVVYDIGGDGIIPHISVGSLVENNIVHDFNARSSGANVGMWGWDVDDLVIQYNEAYNGVDNGHDSEGFDIDAGNLRTKVQYNYSHDNGGGFVLICNGFKMTTRDGVVRYNISQNDQRSIVNVHCVKTTNTQIYNNTLYAGAANAYVVTTNTSSGPEHVSFYNNIFYVANSTTLWDPGSMGYDYNLYYGYHPSGEPADAHKLTSDPLLVNPGSGTSRTAVDGYKLQTGSPAIGSGLLMANNGGKDYWGNPVSPSAAPNRGAYGGSGIAGGPTATPTPTNTPGGPTATATPTSTPTPAAGVNLALGKSVTVSSTANGYPGSNAVDGSLTTFWRTLFGSNLPSEWITVDLGQAYSVNRVVLRWNTYYAKNYTIQVSGNGTSWTTVSTVINGDGGTDDLTFSAASARYVKMDSTAWTNNNNRNRLNEYEVYGQ